MLEFLYNTVSVVYKIKYLTLSLYTFGNFTCKCEIL